MCINGLLVFIFALLLLSACTNDDAHNHPNNISAKELYELHCAGCHKKLGQGKFLKGIPPNRYTQLTISEIVKKIKTGEQHQSDMKVFNNMEQQEAKRIAIYLLEHIKVRKTPDEL